jgi:hypothetical protein
MTMLDLNLVMLLLLDLPLPRPPLLLVLEEPILPPPDRTTTEGAGMVLRVAVAEMSILLRQGLDYLTLLLRPNKDKHRVGSRIQGNEAGIPWRWR